MNGPYDAAVEDEGQARNAMLKITITETQTEKRWVLQGQLVGPWVDEFRRCWKQKQQTVSTQKCVVDLNDVTFIDKSGERLLRAIGKKGAELVANGVYTKHVVERVKSPERCDVHKVAVLLFALLLVGPLNPGLRADSPRMAKKSVNASSLQCMPTEASAGVWS